MDKRVMPRRTDIGIGGSGNEIPGQQFHPAVPINSNSSALHTVDSTNYSSHGKKKLGEVCEELLASSEWLSANTGSLEDSVRRLELVAAAGLPSMRLISAATIEQLGRIPRSDEDHSVDAIQALQNSGTDEVHNPLAVIIFLSHRWKRPNWCEVLKKDIPHGSPERIKAEAQRRIVGDPDDRNHSKARSLIEWLKWFKEGLETRTLDYDANIPRGSFVENADFYFWIDFSCVDQHDPGPAMCALPAYIAISQVIACAWDARNEYIHRAWCQVELLLANAFSNVGDRALVIPENFVFTEQKGFSMELCVLPDPLDGQLSDEKDRVVIEGLRYIAINSTAFTCPQICLSYLRQRFLISTMSLCLCFGLFPYSQSRNLLPGTAVIGKLIPNSSGALGRRVLSWKRQESRVVSRFEIQRIISSFGII